MYDSSMVNHTLLFVTIRYTWKYACTLPDMKVVLNIQLSSIYIYLYTCELVRRRQQLTTHEITSHYTCDNVADD